MDSSKGPPNEGVSLVQNAKRDVKRPTRKRRGITKSTTTKKHPMTAAMHIFTANPRKKSRKSGLKTFELLQTPEPHLAMLSSSTVDQKFSFHQIETPATIAQSYVSTMYTSFNSTTNTEPPPVDSVIPTPSLCLPRKVDSPMHSLSNPTPTGSSLTDPDPALCGFVNSAPILQPCNNFTPRSSLCSSYNATSRDFINLFPLSESPLNRKRSADALKASEPKRQKIGSSDSLDESSMNRQGSSMTVMRPSTTQALSNHVSDTAGITRSSSTYDLDTEKLDNPLPAPIRGLKIPSLLNPQEVLHNTRQEANEPSWNSSASSMGGGHVPLSVPALTAAPIVSTGGEGNRHSQAASPLSLVNAAEHAHHTSASLSGHNHVSLLNLPSETSFTHPAIDQGIHSIVNYSQGAVPSSRLDPTKSTHDFTVSKDDAPVLTTRYQDTRTFLLGDKGAVTSKDHAPGNRTPVGKEQLHISPLNFIDEDQVPTTHRFQDSLAALGDGDSPIIPNNNHVPPPFNRIGTVVKKRKYEDSEETRAESNPKRAKPEVIRTTPAQKSKGGRPRNPPKPPRVRTSLPTLTCKNPVKDFPIDLWGMVFSFSTPKFLLKAQRVNKLFNLALQYTRSWESARRSTYPGCPDPPAGMCEQEYAFHLEAGGCQAVMEVENGENREIGENGENVKKASKCQNKCRKTYWAFQKKWCAKHFKERLISSRDVQNMEADYPDLRHLLPFASFDSWDTYLCAGNHTTKPAWLRCSPHKTQYLKEDVKKVCQEYDRIRAPCADGTTTSPEEITAWVDTKRAEVVSNVKKRQEIETWVETRNKAELEKHGNLTQAKREFFKAKALNMTPPLEFEALALTQSYINAIAIKKEPSERSWQILEDKLKKERYYTEAIVHLDREVLRRGVPPDDFLGFGPRGIENEMTMEGMLVRGLAREQIEAAKDAFPNAAETDEWIPRILCGFYDAFEALPDHQKLNDDGNVISLSMYHAKVVVNTIEDCFQVSRRDPIPTHLRVKCPLCPHKGNNTTRRFDHHVTHIGKKHARSHEGFVEWRMFEDRSFPWMRVPWPKNIPVLRNSSPSPGKWDLGD